MPQDTKPLHINLANSLHERIDKYRHKQMFATRTEAIEFLLDYALKANPKRPEQNPKPAAE